MDLSREIVASYLNQHPDFLDEYVSEHVDVERVERWVIRRSQREKKVKPPANQSPTTTPSGRPAFTRKTSLSRWKVSDFERKYLAPFSDYIDAVKELFVAL